MSHKFNTFDECQSFILQCIKTDTTTQKYLNSLPPDYREYYVNTPITCVIENEICSSRKLLCGEKIYELMSWYMDTTKTSNVYEHEVDEDLIHEVIIDNKDDLFNFIKSEFFKNREQI